MIRLDWKGPYRSQRHGTVGLERSLQIAETWNDQIGLERSLQIAETWNSWIGKVLIHEITQLFFIFTNPCAITNSRRHTNSYAKLLAKHKPP